jgi:predicted dinucleotide-binding enzyme
MKIGVLGTGGVGQTLAAKLAELGHEVIIGTRSVEATEARADFSLWLASTAGVRVGTLADAAAHGQVLINALAGHASLAGLEAAGEENLAGKVLMDIANPLDFSRGMPPPLFVSNTDSLGEQIQRRFPAVKVVKTLNTVTASLMVNPRGLADGEHIIYVSGDDAEAKAAVTDYLQTWFGWRHVIDLGDIRSARATEAVLLLWIQLWGKLGTASFNFKIVQ